LAAKKKYPIPHNEHERLQEVHNLSVLDTLPDEQLDTITKLASVICNVPISLITVLDQKRQWFKSKYGLDVSETPREDSFCQYSILENTFFEVEDAHNDERFAGSPLVVGEPNIRFYASYPLYITDDIALGSLCVIDRKPNKLNEHQKETLQILAKQVANLFSLHREIRLKEQYLQFFRASSDLFCLINKEGYVLESNGAFNKQLKYPVGENRLLFKDILRFQHQAKFLRILKEMKESSSYQSKNLLAKTKSMDSQLYHIDWNICFDAQNSDFLFISGRDMTEEIKAKEMLEIKQKQSNQFIENIQGLIFICDKDMTLLNVNDVVCHIFGQESSAIVGNRLSAYVHAQDRLDFGETFQDCTYGKAVEGVFRMLDQRSEARYIRCKITTSEATHANRTFMISGLDITDLTEMESLLDIARYKEQISRFKDDFLSNVSHELRTPMNAIMGFTNLLLGTSLDFNQTDYAESINYASQKLLHVINDIIDFNSIKSGELILKNDTFDLQKVLHRIFAVSHSSALRKELMFTFTDPANMLQYLVGDSLRFSQILINIINNAIKFTDRGKVDVSVSQQVADSICHLEFVISDTGIGIADTTDDIFEDFSRLDSNINRQHEGTGLGLSISKELLLLLGGTISYKSQEGVGSCFTINIQFKLSNELPEILPFSGKETLSGCKILLVEDGILNQKLAKKILSSYDAEVDIADNGAIAIEFLANNKYDLILLDIQMPVMDGFTTAKNIRNELKLTLPIVAVTGHSQYGEEEKCIKAGMNDYLSKPFTKEELFSKVVKFYKKGKFQ
jgi:PAS domain S-box-containing protein